MARIRTEEEKEAARQAAKQAKKDQWLREQEEKRLPLQADPQEERPAAGAERPLPPPHRRQSDDRGRYGCGHGGGHPRPQQALHHAGHLHPRLRQEQKGRQRGIAGNLGDLNHTSAHIYRSSQNCMVEIVTSLCYN